VRAFRLVDAEKAGHPVSRLCSVLEVTRQGYYAWRSRPPSPRRQRDLELEQIVREAFRDSRETYGAPRLHAELKARGIKIGKKRIARLMREIGLQGVSRRGGRRKAPVAAAASAPAPPDLVKRRFHAERPDELWLADITYIPTWEGWLFLSVVMDVCTRRIVGWSMRDDLHADLVVDALGMAVTRRQPANGVIHHSDRGSQPRLNRSSQQSFVDLLVNTHSMLRPASASQASCGAGC
jgi:putative transposase